VPTKLPKKPNPYIPLPDESYSLYIPAMCPRDCATTKGTCSLHVSIAAPTQYGAMRALESLSQLLHFDYDGGEFILGDGPWTITDFPRYLRPNWHIIAPRFFFH
jgi:hypothetical protein